MKKQFICMMMLLISTLVFADEWKWNEKTRDAAYEAPNSKLQKKWFSYDQNETTFQFDANGTVIMVQLLKMNHFDARVALTLTGKYMRNKDHLNVTWTGVQVKPNQADMDAMSARNRDNMLEALKTVGPNFTSNYKNKTEYNLILRLDDECLILTRYDPRTKLFNDVEWTTLFNEFHKKKVEEQRAQLEAELARQDSIRQVQKAEEKARREAEEKAKREAEEKAKREAEEARIKAENEYWTRMGAEKKAAADKAAAEGVNLVDLGLSVRWADRNIGATSPKDKGNFYLWGEVTPKNEEAKYKPLIKLSKGVVLDANSDPATVKLGKGFHVPSVTQWKELFDNCKIEFDQEMKGFVFTGPNGNSIIIPITKFGSDAMHWTNSMDSDNKKEAHYSSIGDNMKCWILGWDVKNALPVRAVME